MDNVKVEVRGIRELGRAFKKIDAELPRELKVRFKAIAERIAADARGKATADFKGGHGKAIRSVKSKSTARGAGIAFGGQAAPYYPWLDFGGTVGRGHKPGRAFSGSVKREWLGTPVGEGRYIYPSIREHRPETERDVEDAVNDVARKAGFETRQGI